MDMIEVKARELSGPALDWAVATALNLDAFVFDQATPYVYITDPECLGRSYSPSTQWDQGGPLIEKHRIELRRCGTNEWWADNVFPGGADVNDWCATGPTILIAACRALAEGTLGETIEVPKDLTVGAPSSD